MEKSELQLHKNTCSITMASVNIICVVAGTGILGLSFALKMSGWLGLILFGLCCFSMLMVNIGLYLLYCEIYIHKTILIFRYYYKYFIHLNITMNS